MKKTVLRFMACSDLHYKGPACVTKKRFEEGLRQLYAYADKQEYPYVDAVYIVGDFTEDGEAEQMRLVKESLDSGLRSETVVNLSISSPSARSSSASANALRSCSRSACHPSP